MVFIYGSLIKPAEFSSVSNLIQKTSCHPCYLQLLAVQCLQWMQEKHHRLLAAHWEEVCGFSRLHLGYLVLVLLAVEIKASPCCCFPLFFLPLTFY